MQHSHLLLPHPSFFISHHHYYLTVVQPPAATGAFISDLTSLVPGLSSSLTVAGDHQQQQFLTTSLYVGDLEANVTDSQLYDLFNQVSQVVSVRICRDSTTRRALDYDYVNYSNPQGTAKALDVLNFAPLNGTLIGVTYSHRDSSIRKSGAGNIFIRNLDKVRVLEWRGCVVAVDLEEVVDVEWAEVRRYMLKILMQIWRSIIQKQCRLLRACDCTFAFCLMAF